MIELIKFSETFSYLKSMCLRLKAVKTHRYGLQCCVKYAVRSTRNWRFKKWFASKGANLQSVRYAYDAHTYLATQILFTSIMITIF